MLLITLSIPSNFKRKDVHKVEDFDKSIDGAPPCELSAAPQRITTDSTSRLRLAIDPGKPIHDNL